MPANRAGTCGHLAAGSTDTGNRLTDRLECDGHVERICVNKRSFIAHDRDVPFPEQKIAATYVGLWREFLAERLLLHVAVARAGNPARISATCTRPEQSRPSEVFPPHRYVAPRKPSATATTRKSYDGPLVVGEDLMCFEVGETISVRRPPVLNSQ